MFGIKQKHKQMSTDFALENLEKNLGSQLSFDSPAGSQDYFNQLLAFDDDLLSDVVLSLDNDVQTKAFKSVYGENKSSLVKQVE